MSEHYYSSTKKNTYSQEPTYLPTAEKSNFKYERQSYFERTPEKLETYSAKKGSRLSDAKRSIDQCIHMVSEKKKMNEEAFGQVKNINHQILGSLSWLNPIKTSLFQPLNKTTQQYRRDQTRDIAVSQFDWKPFASPQPIRGEQTLQYPTFHEQNSNKENVDLRSKLNNEIKRNNDLLKHVSHLEAEVASLKSSKYQVQGPNIQEVLLQNRYLKNQLANSQAGSNYDLIQQLQRLKSENSELRRDTINLLKSRPY